MKRQTEKMFMDYLRRELGSLPQFRLWRQNVGQVELEGGRVFQTGLPRGAFDLSGIYHDGRRVEIEVKLGTKLSEHQVAWGKMIAKFGGIAVCIHGAKGGAELSLQAKEATAAVLEWLEFGSEVKTASGVLVHGF